MKLGDLRKKLRGIDPECPMPACKRCRGLGRVYEDGDVVGATCPDCRKVWTEPGGRPLDGGEIAPPWSDGKRRVIGLDVGMSGDETAMVTMSRGEDGVLTIEDIKTATADVREHPFTGKHRDMHEPEDMRHRRICKAVNAVPGAVLTDHRYCATTVRTLGKSLGDIYMERHSGDWRAWQKLAGSVVTGLLGEDGRARPVPYFVVCPSTSDVPTLVKWEAARSRARLTGAEPPDEPMHRMFAAVSSRALQDDDGRLLPVHLSRCSAFALYPAEVRVCWTCGGRGKTDVIARVDEREPDKAVCERCRGFGRLWDHRPHHAERSGASDERLTRLEDAPAPSRLDR